MFLNELEELLELVDPDEVTVILELLFRKITACIESQHFQVAERALFFWNNEYIVNLIVHHREIVLPIVFPALQRNVQWHWNRNVHSLSYNVQKLLAEMDADLFEDCSVEYNRQKKLREAEDRHRREIWKSLERRAQLKQDEASNLPALRLEKRSSVPTHNGSCKGLSVIDCPCLTLTTANFKQLQTDKCPNIISDNKAETLSCTCGIPKVHQKVDI